MNIDDISGKISRAGALAQQKITNYYDYLLDKVTYNKRIIYSSII